MASARKKQDEKNLKVLRDLAALPHNKYCFDCNQRGPTYVNVTIGSFVCTKCSGMLRGLTPPHRVKSISMATFTTEEVELLRSRGNTYCHKTWMGLYEGNTMSDVRDEQVVRDFMIDKYEKKRYFLDPSVSMCNGTNSNNINTQSSINSNLEVKPLSSIVAQPKFLKINGYKKDTSIVRNKKEKSPEFIANFNSADIYNSENVNKTNGNIEQPSFANFDSNPIFNNTNPFLPAILPCQNLNSCRNWETFDDEDDITIASVPAFNTTTTQNNVTGSSAPSEDRYAALKDLDNAFKTQPIVDWNSGSNSSLYNSATPTSSLYSSPSPQGSMYGSPSQGQFVAVFPQEPTKVCNPFNGNGVWGNNDNQSQPNNTANPFRIADNNKMNGVTQSFQVSAFPPRNGSPWTTNGNPFMVLSSQTVHNWNSESPRYSANYNACCLNKGPGRGTFFWRFVCTYFKTTLSTSSKTHNRNSFLP